LVFILLVLLIDGFNRRRRSEFEMIPVYLAGEVIPPYASLIIGGHVCNILLPPRSENGDVCRHSVIGASSLNTFEVCLTADVRRDVRGKELAYVASSHTFGKYGFKPAFQFVG